MALYVGVLDGEPGAWGARIPDLPGVFGAGATPEKAVADVASAAREWCASQLAAGFKIPKPRTLGEVISNPATGFDGDATVLINVIVERGRPVKANVSLDAGTLEAIDTEAERQGLTRSAFMISAALEKIIHAKRKVS